MARLIFLLAVGGLAWWGYGRIVEDEAVAASVKSGDGGGLEDELAPQETPRLQASVRPPGTGAAAPGGSGDDDTVARFIAQLKAGDARVRANAFKVVERTRDPVARRRIADAILKLVDEADSAEAALAWLGTGDAFLHSSEGCAAGARVVDRVHQEQPEEAVRLSTRVLDLAMSGRIELSERPARDFVDATYERHQHLVRRVVFDPANSARARRYEVQSGDSLDSIARRFRKSGINVESGTLALVNRIDNPNALAAGKVLRIPIDPVHCVAHKGSFLLATYIGDVLVRLYWMAHGKEGHDTPETTFVVADKIPNPDWHHDGKVIPFGDPDNPLGRFFVKFNHESYSGFGVHGTNEPESIGSRASLGCLRLLPRDIDEFTQFVPRGAELQIR